MKKVKCHVCMALTGSSLPLHNNVRQHGVDAFTWEVLEFCKPWELNDRELWHIAQLVNTKTPTYNLIGVRRERDVSLYNGKDVSNKYVTDRPRKAPKEYRRFTARELGNLPTLRAMGYTMEQIARLHDCTAQAVGKALKRLRNAVANAKQVVESGDAG